MISLSERTKTAKAKQDAVQRQADEQSRKWQAERLERLKKQVPSFVKEIVGAAKKVADKGKNEYEHIIWDSNDDYLVKDLIVAALKRKKDLKVETEPYFSHGSYGDQGEVFVESSSRLYVRLSW